MTIAEVTPPMQMLWLDMTRACQLECVHCYNSSGPGGGHGQMTLADWFAALDQAASAGARHIQLIGGEPTLHPDALELAARAVDAGISVEVYSNLVHVSDAWWTLLQRQGISLATSYYSHDPDRHNAMTGRPASHRHTRRNLIKAVELGVALRVGIITADSADVEETRRELEDLGVTRIGVDHIRPFGRGAAGQAPDMAGLCGACGDGRAAIGPDGAVSPCVFSGWMSVGNIRTTALTRILDSPAMGKAQDTIRAGKDPKNPPPPPPPNPVPCSPDNDICRPGGPPSWCNPRK